MEIRNHQRREGTQDLRGNQEDKNNNIIVYDINTNTNYNNTVEEKLRANGKQGASDKVVEFLSTIRG